MRSTCRSALLLALALSLLAGPALAQVKTFRKEVKQIMGSAQSQDDARAAALAKARRDAVEEAGIWVESQSVVQNFKLEKDQVTTLATGITQTKVIEEGPYSEAGVVGFRVVAEVRVDNAGLAERVKQFLADRAQVQQAKAISEREQALLARLADLERQMAALKAGPSEERQAVRAAVQENARQLAAREWFDKGFGLADVKRDQYNDPAQAVAFYSEALKLDPNFVIAYVGRGTVYQQLGQWQRAIQDYNDALKLDPKVSWAFYIFYLRGNAYTSLGQPQRAIQDYDHALMLDPNNALAYYYRSPAYYNRGLAYRSLGQEQRAIEDFDQALKFDLNMVSAYIGRGNAYSALGLNERAIEDFDQALRLDHNNALAYYNRGNAYINLGQPYRAIQDYDQALKLDSNDIEGYRGRGLAYVNLGQYERAIQDFDQALKLDPNNAVAYINRGEAYFRLGQRARAYQDGRKACELGLQFVCNIMKKIQE